VPAPSDFPAECRVFVMRTRTSFQKRQKEIARAEKQRDKIARRQQKKLMPKQPETSDGEPDEAGEGPDAPDAQLGPPGESEPTS